MKVNRSVVFNHAHRIHRIFNRVSPTPFSVALKMAWSAIRRGFRGQCQLVQNYYLNRLDDYDNANCLSYINNAIIPCVSRRVRG